MLALVMSDSRKTPPPLLGSKRPSTRGQSQDDRDAEGFAARRERDAQGQQHAVEFSHEEITGKYEGEELVEMRRLRKDSDRIERLETKHDELKSDVKDVRSDVKLLSSQVSDLRADVAGAVGKMSADVAGAVGKIEGQEAVLTEMLSIVKKTAVTSAERDHVTFTAKVDVDKAHELARVEVDKETELARVEVSKEQQLEPIKARNIRRRAIAKLVGGVFVGAYALYEFLHRVGVL